MPGPKLPIYVYSRTSPDGDRNGVTFVRDAVPHVRTLKETTDGKPLWLWGGGELFGELARAGLVDGIEVAVIPVVLGAGIPLMAATGPRLDAGAPPTPAVRRDRDDVPRIRRQAHVMGAAAPSRSRHHRGWPTVTRSACARRRPDTKNATPTRFVTTISPAILIAKIVRLPTGMIGSTERLM